MALTTQLNPDIVLVDITLEIASGLDIAQQLLRRSPNTRIVLFAGSNDEKLLFEALRIGVHGYLQKTLSIEDLRRALRAVQCGERVLGESQAVTQVAVEFHRLTREQNRLNRGIGTMEIKLLGFASKGFTNKEIAARYSISEQTVKHHLRNIFDKVGVSNRLELALFAINHRLVASE